MYVLLFVVVATFPIKYDHRMQEGSNSNNVIDILMYNLALFYLLAIEVTNIDKKSPRDRSFPISRIANKKEDNVTIPNNVFTSFSGMVHFLYLAIFIFIFMTLKGICTRLLVKSLIPIIYRIFGNFVQCCPILAFYH